MVAINQVNGGSWSLTLASWLGQPARHNNSCLHGPGAAANSRSEMNHASRLDSWPGEISPSRWSASCGTSNLSIHSSLVGIDEGASLVQACAGTRQSPLIRRALSSIRIWIKLAPFCVSFSTGPIISQVGGHPKWERAPPWALNTRLTHLKHSAPRCSCIRRCCTHSAVTNKCRWPP